MPRESGYAVSYVKEELNAAKRPLWITEADISAPSLDAVWDYTPQTLTEGWLRLNPTLLSFEILNAGDPTAPLVGGATQAVILRVTNRKPLQIAVHPGVIAPEGTPAQGSIFYVHFGTLVAQSAVAAMAFEAVGWTFQAMSDSTYGRYWAATPVVDIILGPGDSFDIAVSGMEVATNVVQAQITTDYYDVDGANDGVFLDSATITQSAS